MKSFTQKATRLNNRLYCLLISLLLTFSGFSQNVGINATGAQPNASAGLDIDFPNKGLLIPRVALTSTTSFAPLAAHVAGMVVYNTATAGDVTPGFYYDNGIKWIPGFLKGQSVGDMLYWSGSEWLRIPIGVPGQYLQISGGFVPTWGGNVYSMLTTTAASAITITTATSGGNVISDGGSAVVSRGVCWNTVGAPTIADTKTSNGVGTGIFTSSLTGLLSGTTYYVRSYAINSTVVNYGDEITFTTLANIPTMAATTAASVITANSATTGGNVSVDGGAPILERGVCYGTISNPTILTGTKVIDPATTTGSFSVNLTGLTGGTTYYVRAYATNSQGTAYATQITFATTVMPPTLVTVAATNISGASATSGGSMSWNGPGYSNYQYFGVEYSVNSNFAAPTTKVNTNSSNFSYSTPVSPNPWVTNITGLAANTTYYIRSFLYVYRAGWSYIYGDVLSFSTTSPTSPVVGTTTAATLITGSTVRSGGAIISDGGSAITAKGVCWGTSPSPTLGASNYTTDGTGTASFISNPTGLSGSTTYYVRAYATNGIGTSYSAADQTFTTCVASPYKVGDFAGGGRVFYVNCDGSGLIAALSDQSSNTVWGCSGTNIVTSNTLGSGAANTAAILAGCADRPIAASVASSCTDGGYNDWYLPSQTELGLLINSGYVFGVQVSYYCSSSQSNATTISGYYYANNWQASGLSKTTQFKVRAIRSFSPPALSTVTTTAITNIGGETATSGGNVTSDGGAPVTARGVCWSTTSGPTIALTTKTVNGTGSGTFVSSITGLTIGTLYYVRSYATNAAGTSYGAEVSFTTTSLVVPTVTTSAITNIGLSATSGGNITNDGGSAVTARGVCWSTVTGPTISDSKTTDGTGTGSFVSSITGLTNAVTYYVKAYATNAIGTAYGSEVSFTASGPGLPTVTTTPIVNQSGTATSISVDGEVVSDGGSPVTARGVVYSSISWPPTILDTHTSDGTGVGTFTSNISGLIPGNFYTILAYATNSYGTAYGAETYYMPIGKPNIGSGQLSYWAGDAYAQIGLSILSDGGDPLTAVGAVWNTSPNPTVEVNGGITTELLSPMPTTAVIQPIVQLTTYYIRAYATNSYGTSYSQEIVFTPGVTSLPTVTTDPILNKIGSFAEGGATVLSDGGDPLGLTAAGLCWSESADPTVDVNLGFSTDGYSGQFYSTITGLTVGTTYHVRAYATNTTGTAYGADISFVATAATLGQVVQGGNIYGTVLSVDGTGEHGILADSWGGWATTDWGCNTTTTGASGTALGTGEANTTAIVNDITNNACISAESVNYNDFAAVMATWNGMGWYLPSKDEVDLLHTKAAAAGLLLNDPMWSSTEIDATHAWYFDGTTWVSDLKSSLHNYWPIKSF